MTGAADLGRATGGQWTVTGSSVTGPDAWPPGSLTHLLPMIVGVI
jgi:hypothetical protein